MAGPQHRFRGVRQRQWGSWVSEIRHPILKTRIWLGTFKTAEDAARAYDEAARLMCGTKARTNFSHSPNASQSSKALSATLAARLHKCHIASSQITKQSTQPAPSLPNSEVSIANHINYHNNNTPFTHDQQPSQVQQQEVEHYFTPLEEDHIEQMIDELLDYESTLELCGSPSH